MYSFCKFLSAAHPVPGPGPGTGATSREQNRASAIQRLQGRQTTVDKTATSSDEEDDEEEARAAGVTGGEGRAGPREQRLEG